MDTGAIPFLLFVVPFWAGVISVGIILVLLIPIGINVAIRIVIDSIIATRRRGRGDTEAQRSHNISLL
ncbi:hypothetical protein [Microbacterium sp. UFMG61]|uniref:hypothetical protein n=1 Tax=Microbacterium sp. UFMG61 TaxID=2745935 RepID=UPI00188FFDC9|nr:hypothetical protein [Microbacterium sp. UFMG61]